MSPVQIECLKQKLLQYTLATLSAWCIVGYKYFSERAFFTILRWDEDIKATTTTKKYYSKVCYVHKNIFKFVWRITFHYRISESKFQNPLITTQRYLSFITTTNSNLNLCRIRVIEISFRVENCMSCDWVFWHHLNVHTRINIYSLNYTFFTFFSHFFV